jgi:hypothetical protein
MLWIIAITLLALWILGVVTAYTLNGFIHVFLAVALVVLIVRLASGHRRL